MDPLQVAAFLLRSAADGLELVLPVLKVGWAVFVAWGLFVLGNLALARSDPDRWSAITVLTHTPLHLRLPWFVAHQRRLEALGFRELGVLRTRSFLWTLASRISWSEELQVFAWTFSFLGRPFTGFASVLPNGVMVNTGVTEAEPGWYGAVYRSGKPGSLQDRLAMHEQRVSEARSMYELDDEPVIEGTLSAVADVYRCIHRNQLRPHEPLSYHPDGWC